MTDQSDILTTEEPVAATQEQAVTQTSEAAPTVDVNSLFGEHLSAIKNKDGLQKYASVEDALKGATFREEHVKTLEDENSELRSRLEAMSQTATHHEPTQTAQDSMKAEDVYELMRNYESSKVKDSNRSSVRDTLLDHCKGDLKKADELLNNRAKELGISRSQLSALAAESPTAATRLLGLTTEGTSSNYTSSSISSDAVDAHVKKDLPQAKRLPIGASSDHLVSEWRAAKEEINQKLGL